MGPLSRMGEGEGAAPPEAANGGQAGPRDEELVTPNRGLNDDLKVTLVGGKAEAASVPAPAPRFSLGSLVWTKITGTRFCSDLFQDFFILNDTPRSSCIGSNFLT